MDIQDNLVIPGFLVFPVLLVYLVLQVSQVILVIAPQVTPAILE